MKTFELDMNWYVFITLLPTNESVLIGMLYYFLDAIYYATYAAQVGYESCMDGNYIITIVQK